jgi:hypothetical protein
MRIRSSVSLRRCAVPRVAGADQRRDDRRRVVSQAALFSPAARVTMAAAMARAPSPRVANWGRQPGTRHRRATSCPVTQQHPVRLSPDVQHVIGADARPPDGPLLQRCLRRRDRRLRLLQRRHPERQMQPAGGLGGRPRDQRQGRQLLLQAAARHPGPGQRLHRHQHRFRRGSLPDSLAGREHR